MIVRTFSVVHGGQRSTWLVTRLWELSRDLVPFEYAVADFTGLDRDCWFGDVHVPTIRSVLEHIARIEAADLEHPIILGENGEVMDGVHRICKAWLRGRSTLPAVRFATNPPPDIIEPAG